MRRWLAAVRLPAALSALFAPIVLLGVASTSPRESEGSHPAVTGAAATRAGTDTLRLVVGDAVDLTVQMGESPTVTMAALRPLRTAERTRPRATVFGTIRPGSDAGDAADMDYQQAKAYHVAQIDLRETAPTTTADYRHYVAYYAGPAAAGGTLGGTTSVAYRLRPDHSAMDVKYGVYQGTFNDIPLPRDSVAYRWHHHLRGMPPTTRWRWVETDERTWTYCDPEGCCENEAGLK